MPHACLIVIGNEILSGRTQDTHLVWLAKQLGELGIPLREVRVVADDEAAIVDAVNQCRARYDYVFTTGGIGPTHDDITAAAISRAFGRAYARHPAAEALLRAHYPLEKLNDARLRMADMPEGAELIDNPVSIAPGFRVENVYVLAGVPDIMRAMFASLKPGLTRGLPLLSRTLSARVTEGNIAEALTRIQARFSHTTIGSYPFSHNGVPGVSLVISGTDAEAIAAGAKEIRRLLAAFDPDVTDVS